jgi:hypothetical protein
LVVAACKVASKLAIMSAAADSVVRTQDFAFGVDSKDPVSETDVEKGSGYVDYSTFVVDKAIERKLLWKFDLHILPMLAIMYLFK